MDKGDYEVEGLWIEDRQSRFEDSIMPQHHLIHMFLFILCRESRYFEDTVKFSICRLRTIYDFFQVWAKGYDYTPKSLLLRVKTMHNLLFISNRAAKVSKIVVPWLKRLTWQSCPCRFCVWWGKGLIGELPRDLSKNKWGHYYKRRDL